MNHDQVVRHVQRYRTAGFPEVHAVRALSQNPRSRGAYEGWEIVGKAWVGGVLTPFKMRSSKAATKFANDFGGSQRARL